jgi:5-formyltetrahydrofolate cyclo-ligase
MWAKQVRETIDIDSVSAQLVEKLRQTEEYKNATNVMLFYPKGKEINLLSLIEDRDKCFYLPKISGNELLCCPYNRGDELCVSCFKTLEPDTAPQDKSLLDLIVVPALAVDKNNYRLGYGGGFYDRFLGNCGAKTLICIPSQLIVNSIFPEEFDIPIDIIISV